MVVVLVVQHVEPIENINVVLRLDLDLFVCGVILIHWPIHLHVKIIQDDIHEVCIVLHIVGPTLTQFKLVKRGLWSSVVMHKAS